MSIRMRVDEITLTTTAGDYHYSFTSPCTVLCGPVGTGKSSLLELIKFALGGSAVLTPVVRSEVQSVQAQVKLAGTALTLRRRLGRDGTTVRVIDPRDEAEVRQLSVRPRPDQPSLSDALLETLGIPRVKIPRARTRATGASVPLTFNDLYSYLYVEQQDIDRSVVHHTEVFREPKRRAVFELLFGLADADQLAAETELDESAMPFGPLANGQLPSSTSSRLLRSRMKPTCGDVSSPSARQPMLQQQILTVSGKRSPSVQLCITHCADVSLKQRRPRASPQKLFRRPMPK